MTDKPIFFRKLYNKLEKVYLEYAQKEEVFDPILIPHRYNNELDIELIGFITAIYSFGAIPKIVATTGTIADLLGSKPLQNLLRFQSKDFKPFYQIRYRFYTGENLVSLLKALQKIYKKYGSLQNLFNESLSEEVVKDRLVDALAIFSKTLREAGKSSAKGFAYMLPDPATGSACKRFMMFLRWMVRKENPDFGIWSVIKPNELIIPLDTHIKRVAIELGFTLRITPDMKMAKEITKNLAKYDGDDPVKYDFALCHLGVEKKYLITE